MDEATELKLLELIEETIFPPVEPWLIIHNYHGTCDVSEPLYQFFKEQNIDIEPRDNTEKVLNLCDQYNIKTRKVIFNRKTKQMLNNREKNESNKTTI